MTVELTYDLPMTATEGEPLQYAEDVAEGLLEDVRSIWPVDTGESRDGWTAKVSDGQLVLTNKVNYVPYIRGGFPLAEAEFLFQAAVEDLGDRLEGITFETLAKTLKGKSLSDVLDMPGLAGFRAGARGAVDQVGAQVPKTAKAIDYVR